jgi:glycoprotein endo-alpha-1,2-mannosidase
MHSQSGANSLGIALMLASTIAIAEAPDSAERLARVRLVITTRAASAAITVEGATVASYFSEVLEGPPAVAVSRTGSTLQVSRNVRGQSAEARFDVILADVAPRSSIAWNLQLDSGAETGVDVYSLSDPDRPALVDHFVSAENAARFTSSSTMLESPGRVEMTPMHPRLVLAHYYPWYTTETWRDPQMADRPLRPYSTEAQSDVDAEAALARAAGIDGFAVSWQGLEAGAGFNDRRMRIVLEAARRTGLAACTYTETIVANPRNDGQLGPDPQTMFEWLADLVDRYGAHPAYLRVGGRPVIFIYAASLLAQPVWTEIMARLETSGRHPFLVGDFARSTLLEPFDGEYQYTNIFAGDLLRPFYRAEGLRVRTYNLLREGDRRRLWVASVTPGFDDSRLVDRTMPRMVDRSNGSVYDDQWKTAIETGADWVMVTSWNEWWENTEVEPSERYGNAYVERTRLWADTFKAETRRGPIRDR